MNLERWHHELSEAARDIGRWLDHWRFAHDSQDPGPCDECQSFEVFRAKQRARDMRGER